VPLPISEYALLGDTRTAALVGSDGSVDWLCLPRFDSPSCFAALLGDRSHGRWLVAPRAPVMATRRSYRGDSLVLDTVLTTAEGTVQVTDFMPVSTDGHRRLVRLVHGLSGRVPMHLELVLRFEYGSVVPWVRHGDRGLRAVAGPDAVVVRSDIPLHGRDYATHAEFAVAEGETLTFELAHHASHRPEPPAVDAADALADTLRWWAEWIGHHEPAEVWDDAVRRSVLTLKALSDSPTGGIVAAPTTSLPETPGGSRNWDYRYCWLRDATFTLYALLVSGFRSEALAWREWLLRAVAGRPEDLQVMYAVDGRRHLPEYTVDALPGYLGAAPVRVGNAASGQFQLDVVGEVLDALHLTRRHGVVDGTGAVEDSWEVQRVLLDHLESAWAHPDSGIWEVRGPQRHFTHSKVMAWVGFDRAVRAVEQFGLDGPVERWRAVRDAVHAEVCAEGYDPDRGTFVGWYGGSAVDAALLMLPLVGFLPASDPRMTGTVAAVEHDLLHDGLVRRYQPDAAVDGMAGGEGVFLPCSFWLADNYALAGRQRDAEHLFARLLGLRNDVGLLSEEYDPATRTMLGNFPQAMTHVALVNTARNLGRVPGPAHHRSGGDRD
jgi:GH15 family glucan-1,4-alpha-glucosidase